jgi:hypothetical protein
MKNMSKRILHEPTLSSLLMIERTILDANDYYTRTQLWKSLPKRMQYQTFKRALDYLEASGKITSNSGHIIYTGVNNPKLAAMIKTSVKI